MPFTNYAEVAAYGEFIEYVTSIGYMPPWSPDETYSHFVGENVLTPSQLATLSDWVEAGKPEGDPADNPGLPDFPDGSQIGTPDHVLGMAESYTHAGDMTEQYQVFVIPSGFAEATSIRALEVLPGNHNVAHHAIIGLDISGTASILDAADPAPGYESFGGFGFNAENSFFSACPTLGLNLTVAKLRPLTCDVAAPCVVAPPPEEKIVGCCEKACAVQRRALLFASLRKHPKRFVLQSENFSGLWLLPCARSSAQTRARGSS